MARVASRRKPGRPPLPPGEGKKVPLNMRTTRAIRGRLESAAGRSGRSLVHEVEYRLEQTFRDEDALGGRECYALFRMMGAAADLIEARTGKPAASDWETSVSVRTAWKMLIAEWAPSLPEKLEAKFEGMIEPLPPLPPALPMVILKYKGPMSLELTDDSAKEKAAFEKASAQQARILKKQQRLLEERDRKQKEIQDYIEGLANIGRETALKLFPAKGKKQG